ncbi:putative late blight resistance protein R1B-16 [Salvia divinorum]|uniref:Late blight resistance protein R1B-16 n=1 Tax=Salvia divinorum TaxID=28513 RepID=A0ABD1H5S9_SALDI
MVGAEEALLEMKDKLTSDRRDLQIIPIVGMGGSGKTTLAINIYQDRLIKEHFHVSAWVAISQEYNIQEMLVHILRQLNQNAGQTSSEEGLGEILYKHLFGRKYLIILDDMWSIKAWDGIRRFLPDNKNGSRIVVTTRLSNLGSDLSNSKNLEMSLLNEVDSWELLSKTVFREKSCPPEMVEIGKRIGKSCKGLPLSIVVIGGLLAKSNHTREFWEFIEENLNSIVNSEDDERCFNILHMSYKQLPVYLKPCFLYMGMFGEDKVIRRSTLVELWVAEGILKPISGKSLEEIAKVASAVVSAKKIVEEQEDLYGDQLDLHVRVLVWEEEEAWKSLTSANFEVKSLNSCASVEERNLLADTSRIVEQNNTTCKRKGEMLKVVSDGLVVLGYNASLCKSKWIKTSSRPAGEHEYIDVITEGGERLIIDVDFRSEFEIARSTSQYKSILQYLPSIFVGKSDRLLQIISIASEAAGHSMKKNGLHIPPWRKPEYVKVKWLGPHTRTAGPDGAVQKTKTRPGPVSLQPSNKV